MGNRISDEELLAEIHRLNDEYGKATTTLLRKHGNYSSRTYSLRFGSWSNALELAGLEQNVVRGLSEKELLDELRRIAEIVGRTPKESDVKKHGICSRGPFIDQFGTWNEALIAAGFTPNRHTEFSDSDFIEDLQRVAASLGYTPRKEDYGEHGRFGTSTVTRAFGSWSDALREAELEIPRRSRQYSRDDLLEELHRVSTAVGGGRPMTADLVAHDAPTPATYRARFGSWRNALAEAGFDLPTRYEDVTPEELLTEVQSVASSLGYTPTRTEMREEIDYPIGWYYRAFGSWSATLDRAGLEPAPVEHISTDALRAELTDLSTELGRTPTQEDVHLYGAYSVSTYQSRFGSWNAALTESGFEPNHRYRIPEEELLDELRALATRLDKLPTTTDTKTHGAFTYVPYIDRFGSWAEALDAAGLEPVPRFEEVTREDLLKEIRSVAVMVEGVPKIFDMREHSHLPSRWYYRAFDSWSEALREAGFSPYRNTDVSRDEAIEHLQAIAEQLGQSPSFSGASQLGEYPASLYITMFGTWNEALQAANLDVNKPHQLTDDELEQEFYRLKDVFGYVPSGPEMTELGSYSVGVYSNRFGSWNEAVRAFGETPRHRSPGDLGKTSYGPLWETRREEAIQRDDEECVICGLSRDVHIEEFDRDLTVHHIDRFLVEFERTGSKEVAHRLPNLVTVCLPCHGTAEGQPKEYFTQFVPEGVLDEVAGNVSDRENHRLDEW